MSTPLKKLVLRGASPTRTQNERKQRTPQALPPMQGNSAPRQDWRSQTLLTRLGVSQQSQRAFFKRSRAIERRELIIGALATICILFSATAFASVTLWAQWTTLGLSALAFLFLFIPLGGGRHQLRPKKTFFLLLKFPLFWLGLLLLLLMLCHGLNTSRFVQDRDLWWRVFSRPPESYIHWLPAGLEAPFVGDDKLSGMNAFRQMIIFASPWLLLCALWAGIRHRRVLAGMGWIIMLGALGLGAWGVQMRMAGVEQLNEKYNVLNTSFFATFLYQNHAGAWLSLQVALASALAFWHWSNARRSQSKFRVQGGPHWFCAVIAICLAFGSICTLSFGSMLTSGIVLFIVVPVAIIWSLIRSGAGRGTITGATMAAVMIAAVAGWISQTQDLSKIESKFNRKVQLFKEEKWDNRALLRKATMQMIEGRHEHYFWTGRGAGSYRWESPPFFRKVLKREERAFYAHCDWLQMLVEWGIVGISIVAAAAIWMLLWLLRNIRYWTPVLLVFASAILLFVGHASMDFLSYSVPLLCLLAFFVVSMVKLGLSRSFQMKLQQKEAEIQNLKNLRQHGSRRTRSSHQGRRSYAARGSMPSGYVSTRSTCQ